LKKIAYLLSHPIQYFSPLLKQISQLPNVDLTVYYCSDASIVGAKDEQFGTNVQWDIPLLDGYKYEFLKNYSLKPSLSTHFWGIVNWDIIKVLRTEKPDVLVVNGWLYFSYVMAIVTAKILGVKVWIRTDNPLNQELLKPRWKRIIKQIIIKPFLFKMVDAFLYVGKQNYDFYRYYGVKPEKLFLSPHSVDNNRFNNIYQNLYPQKTNIKAKLSIPENHTVILFCGKLIPKKNPVALLDAFTRLHLKNISLVFVGDGLLRSEIEDKIVREQLQNIIITGFINQTQISEYYVIADILVLPSGVGETWGLVVNEAMNFHLPIICSDLVGCAADLVIDGENGFVVKYNDVDELVEKLRILLIDNELRSRMGEESVQIIKNYSYERVVNTINEALNKTLP